MILSPFALLLPLALSISPALAADFLNNPRCGDCWCITDGVNGNTCPSNTVGITDTFSETDTLYSTFELLNDPDFLKLQSASGGSCFPFAEAFSNAPIANYPESDAEECVSPDDDDDMVCAYVYESTSPSCEGRKYTIQNFPSTNDAMMSNAAILHQGACGVCSSAQDFGARIQTYGTLETESIKCATSYTLRKDFPALVSCYEALGFTGSCATLWAHFAATNSNNCFMECFPDATGFTKLNEAAPECAPSKCIKCQVGIRDEFDKIAGIEFRKAGITERIAHNCDEFYRVIHDPCLGFDIPDDDEPHSVASTPIEAPAEGEVPVFTPQSANNDGGSAGNSNGTTLFGIAMTLALSMVAAFV